MLTAAINILAAVILCAMAFKYATGHKDNPTQDARSFLLFLLVTGMFQTGGFSLAGLNLSALRLMVWIVLTGFMVTRLPVSRKKAHVCVLIYTAFLLWCGFECLRSPRVMYGVRMFLKLLYPYLVLLLAVRVGALGALSDRFLETVLKAGLIVSIFAGGVSERLLPFLVYNPLTKGLLWPRATFADYGSVMVVVALAVWWRKRQKRYLFAGAWFVLSSIAIDSRTGILAALAGCLTFFVAQYKVKALPIVVLGGYLVLVVTFMVPNVREHMFRNPDQHSIESVGEIKLHDINDSGRFQLWEQIMRKFHRPHPWIGSGLGATQHWFYEVYPGRIKVEHSSYVRLLADTGYIGFGLHLGFLFGIMIVGFLACLEFPSDSTLRMAGALALAGTMAITCCMAFDNVLNYTLATNSYAFAFAGLLIGAADRERRLRKEEQLRSVGTREFGIVHGTKPTFWDLRLWVPPQGS